ncbi:MAG: DUF3303 domain-containing protein [Acidimicrobiia bacterium]|nr:DUF3303 domain-containing protein [Acidimicrobiia bacterium]
MLHMIVMTHGPDTCAAAHPEIAAVMEDGMKRLGQVAESNSVSIQGMWVDPPAHVTYVLVDAPNAHAVSRVMQETNAFHWNTVEIRPVVTVAEATT